MKYLKYFESIIKKEDNRRKGIYIGIDNIIQVYNYLKEKNIRFIILFGYDDDSEDNCFLILIEGKEYEKLPYVDEMGYKDYYIKIHYDGFDDNIFTNWFIPEKIEGNWKIVNNLEEIEIILNLNKYNL